MTTQNPKKTLTTTAAIPVGDNQNSLTARARCPALMQHFRLIAKMVHFNVFLIHLVPHGRRSLMAAPMASINTSISSTVV
jgi:catalase